MNSPGKSIRCTGSAGSDEENRRDLMLKAQAEKDPAFLEKGKGSSTYSKSASCSFLSHLVFAKTVQVAYYCILSADEANETWRTEKLLLQCTC